MAEYLTTPAHVFSRIEDMIGHAKEYVYLLVQRLAVFPQEIFNRLWEVHGKNVKIILIYRDFSVSDENALKKISMLRNMVVMRNEKLGANICFSDKEGVLSSIGFMDDVMEDPIEFGVYFRRNYASDMYDKMFAQAKSALRNGVKMQLDGAAMIEWKPVEIKAEPIPVVSVGTTTVSQTKKLTVKEKQGLLTEMFAAHCKECALKAEGEDRLRVQGAGVVLALSKERVDIIFVRYEAYGAAIEELKAFVLAKHPDLKIWFNYNRINVNAEFANEVLLLFPTMVSALRAFKLVGN